jgi:hypothetical protein
MTQAELKALAGRLSLADYLSLSREVLKAGYDDLFTATVVGELGGGAVVTLPIIPRRPRPSAASPSPA